LSTIADHLKIEYGVDRSTINSPQNHSSQRQTMSIDLVLAKMETLIAKVDALSVTGSDTREKVLEVMRQTSETKTAVEAVVASGGKSSSGESSGESLPPLKTMISKCLFPDSLDATFANGTPSADERKEIGMLIDKILPAAIMDTVRPVLAEARAKKAEKSIYKLLTEDAVNKMLNGRSKNAEAYKTLNNDPRFLEIYNKYFKARGKTPAKNPAPPLNSSTMDKMMSSTAGASWIDDDAPAPAAAAPTTPAPAPIVTAKDSGNLWDE
jgi:hypothetical protein